MIRVKDQGHQSQESSHTHSSKETLLFLSLLSLAPCIEEVSSKRILHDLVSSPVSFFSRCCCWYLWSLLFLHSLLSLFILFDCCCFAAVSLESKNPSSAAAEARICRRFREKRELRQTRRSGQREKHVRGFSERAVQREAVQRESCSVLFQKLLQTHLSFSRFFSVLKRKTCFSCFFI